MSEVSGSPTSGRSRDEVGNRVTGEHLAADDVAGDDGAGDGAGDGGAGPVVVGDAVVADLLAAARAVRERSYSPYSGYRVGAALRTEAGEVFACCNVENAAYPEGVCAEAGAISMMVAGTEGERSITDVVTVTAGETPGSPCGGCRQKIREFSNPHTRVHIAGETGIVRVMTLDELLPESFGPDHLL